MHLLTNQKQIDKRKEELEADTESKIKISIKMVEINNNAINKALKSLKF